MSSHFSLGVKNIETGEYYSWEVSHFKNESKQIFDFLRLIIDTGGVTVGFNSMRYDQPMMHHFFDLYVSGLRDVTRLIELMYQKSKWIIKESLKFFRERFPKWQDVDLYKINHYDNMAKATSLKKAECFLRMDTVEEMPVDFDDPDLTKEEIYKSMKYLSHDVLATYEFTHECLDLITFRYSMTEQFGKSVLNYSDSKIGSEVMTKELIDKMGYNKVFTTDEFGQRKAIQSDYDETGFEVSKLIFPYIKFETEPGKAILEFFKNQHLYNTKGVFNSLNLDDVGELANHVEHKLTNTEINKLNSRNYIDDLMEKSKTKETTPSLFDKKGYPIIPKQDVPNEKGKYPVKPQFERMNLYFKKYWDHLHLTPEEYKTKYTKVITKTGEIKVCSETFKIPLKLKNLNVILGGITHYLGTGGVHSFCGSGIYRANEEYVIWDLDVASYYVAMQIVNEIGASHYDINVWVDVLKKLKKTRETFDKSNPLNKASKIAQLSIYGNYGSDYSNLKDPRTLAQICINGQLSLLMLCEQLTEKIPKIKVLSLNTDGISLAIPRKLTDNVVKIVEDFEDMSGLLFECQDYDAIYQADVNNYIWFRNKEIEDEI